MKNFIKFYKIKFYLILSYLISFHFYLMFHIKFNDGYKVDIPSKIKCYDVVELISKNNISIVFKVIQSVSNKAFAAKVIPLNHLRNQKSIQTVGGPGPGPL